MAPPHDLPISRGVVVARVVAVVVLDLVLAAAGIYLIHSYLAERDAAPTAPTSARPDAGALALPLPSGSALRMVENTTGSDALPAYFDWARPAS